MGSLPILLFFLSFVLGGFLFFLFSSGLVYGFIFTIGYITSVIDIFIMLIVLKPYFRIFTQLDTISSREKFRIDTEDTKLNSSVDDTISYESGKVAHFSAYRLFLKNIFRWVIIAFVLVYALKLVKSFSVENYVIYFVIGIILPFLLFIFLGVYTLVVKKNDK